MPPPAPFFHVAPGQLARSAAFDAWHVAQSVPVDTCSRRLLTNLARMRCEPVPRRFLERFQEAGSARPTFCSNGCDDLGSICAGSREAGASGLYTSAKLRRTAAPQRLVTTARRECG